MLSAKVMSGIWNGSIQWSITHAQMQLNRHGHRVLFLKEHASARCIKVILF